MSSLNSDDDEYIKEMIKVEGGEVQYNDDCNNVFRDKQEKDSDDDLNALSTTIDDVNEIKEEKEQDNDIDDQTKSKKKKRKRTRKKKKDQEEELKEEKEIINTNKEETLDESEKRKK